MCYVGVTPWDVACGFSNYSIYMSTDGSLRSAGELSRLVPGKEYDWTLQTHDAKRAGLHADIRIGDPQTKLLSWAVPKARLPEVGESLLAVRTPLHRYDYGGFEGTIPSGRGAGTVELSDRGRAVVLQNRGDVLRFVLLHHPRTREYMLTRKENDAWFLTGTDPKALPYGKIHYDKLPDPEIASRSGTVSPKIDGAAVLTKLLDDRAEVYSIRPDVRGRAIRHTWRVGGLDRLAVPEDLRGAVLRGELYGKRGGVAIPAAELGGLLNTDTVTSRDIQREKGTQLLIALYGAESLGRHPVPKDRQKLRSFFRRVEKITGGKLHRLPEADTPEEAARLIRDIRAGEFPLTREGVVVFRHARKPGKWKTSEDADVYIREIFPADSDDKRAGGFSYSLTPDGPVVGRVGSGISRSDAKDMLAHPERWTGRLARIAAQEQFDSGAFRSPVFIARHDG